MSILVVPQRIAPSVHNGVGRCAHNGVRTSGRPTSFGAAYGVALSTATISRKAYPRGIASDAAITASAGAEYSLDGGAWTSDAGVWGTTKQIRARITSSADYETTVTATITIGGVAYAFPVTTMAEAGDFLYFGEDQVLFGTDGVEF